MLADALSGEDDPETVQRLVGRMVFEAERAARTIDDLLQLTEIELGTLTTEKALALFVRTAQLDEAEVMGDPTKVAAATAIVETVGRLPLTVSLAAAMTENYADNWCVIRETVKRILDRRRYPHSQLSLIHCLVDR